MSFFFFFRQIARAVLPSADPPARGVSVLVSPDQAWTETAFDVVAVSTFQDSVFFSLPDETIYVVEKRRRFALNN
jgi:hypothetical protein